MGLWVVRSMSPPREESLVQTHVGGFDQDTRVHRSSLHRCQTQQNYSHWVISIGLFKNRVTFKATKPFFPFGYVSFPLEYPQTSSIGHFVALGMLQPLCHRAKVTFPCAQALVRQATSAGSWKEPTNHPASAHCIPCSGQQAEPVTCAMLSPPPQMLHESN